MKSRRRISTSGAGELLQHYFNEIDECLARALAHISQRLVDVCYFPGSGNQLERLERPLLTQSEHVQPEKPPSDHRARISAQLICPDSIKVGIARLYRTKIL